MIVIKSNKLESRPRWLTNSIIVLLLSIIIVISINIFSCLVHVWAQEASESSGESKLIVISFVQDRTSDFFKRFNRSLSRLELENAMIFNDDVIGSPSLSIDRVKKALNPYRNDDKLILMLSFDDGLVVNANSSEFLTKYEEIRTVGQANIIFPANYANQQEANEQTPNCRAMIGKPATLWTFFNQIETTNDKNNPNHDLQRSCNLIYADTLSREKLGLTIDHKFELFQPLQDFVGLENKLKLVESLGKCELHNTATLTKPLAILPTSASSPTSSHHLLSLLGNYLGRAWSRKNGSALLNELMLENQSNGEELTLQSSILIGLFILEPTPFLEHFFKLVLELSWPKEKINLILYNAIPWHQAQVDSFRAQASQLPYASFRILTNVGGPSGNSVELFTSADSIAEPSLNRYYWNRKKRSETTTTSDLDNNQNRINFGSMISNTIGANHLGDINLNILAEFEARSTALEHCKHLGRGKCDYYLHLESLARIREPDLVQRLIETKQTFVGPLLTRPNRLWSNFWASQTEDGFYARSFDYVDLVKGEKLGLWAVNLVQHAYLVEGSFIRNRLAWSPSSSSSSSSLHNNGSTAASPKTKLHSESDERRTKEELTSSSIGDERELASEPEDETNSSAATAKSNSNSNFPDSRQEYISSLIGSPNQRVTATTHSNGSGLQAENNRLRINYALMMAKQLLKLGKMQFILNTKQFGHLVDPTSYNLNRTRPDFYQLDDNILDWEREYLHQNYTHIFDGDDEPSSADNQTTITQPLRSISDHSKPITTPETSPDPTEVKPSAFIEEPCRDVYWFPLVSNRFTRDLIAIMEAFGRWSSGTNDDPRIEGGYESVPTRDIHFRQVGLHEMWLQFLRYYVMPVQLRQYIGYEHDPPRADLAFVVRYHPEEQPSLRPHHDSSTYTLNIALNSPSSGDYEGGGCRFVRQNCSVTQSRAGWALIHPGRLTHYHEGLPVRSGTRYIMVTFIDP